MAAQQGGTSSLKPVEGVGVHHGQKPLGRVEPPRLKAQLRRGERARRSPARIGGQPEGALQERGRSCHAPALPAGASFQLLGDRLVGCEGSRSEMPGPTVRINLSTSASARWTLRR